MSADSTRPDGPDRGAEIAAEPSAAVAPSAAAPMESVRPARPVTLVACVALLALQAGAFVALGIAVVTGPTPAEGAGAVYPVAVFTLLAGALLAIMALHLWRLRRWPRGAATAWGVLLMLVGLAQLSVNGPVAIAVALAGAATAVTAFAPATRLALAGDSDGPDEDDADGPTGSTGSSTPAG
ncbi:MAG: hypothetical protein J0H73_16050 [Salana multivorans]|uniref:hypothetical protein n=1 Tax=Salana multivorans TaxID=120377 RepID=UPI001AD32AB6|nr:hypothetical protein [Salana multivorans]MBN8883809.1 hypothetical protein [Salana multivorans]